MKPTLLFSLVSLAALAGCAHQTALPPANVATPAAFKEAPVAAASTSSSTPTSLTTSWWSVFHDPELDALQQRVVAANADLQQAGARLAEARALARLTEAELLPHLSLSQDITREQLSGTRSGGDGETRIVRDHHLEAQLDYEFDLWGRQRHATAAARADVRALALDTDTLRLALTAEAARHYHELRALDLERALIETTLALRRDAVHLQESRHRAGLINETDVARARTELANVEAELHAVARRRARLEHALAVLCGLSPAEFAVAVRLAPETSPEIPAGLPSLLLRRRADIAAAEEGLRAASERVAVAHADFFPRLALTGSAGFASADLNTLLQSDSHAWSFGPSMYLPIFDGGKNRASLAAARARYDAAAAKYRQVVLDAFREVEDALSDLRTLGEQDRAVQCAAASARDTAALAQARYDRGLTNYLDVVDAQRAALQAERLVVQLRGEQASTTVSLAQALGGGWNH